MAVFNVIPVPLLIGAGIGLSASETTLLVAGCLLVTGLATILQCLGAGPAGARLPIVLECSFVFVTPGIALGSQYGLATYTGACLVGSVVALLVWTIFRKQLLRLFEPYITGAVVTVLGHQPVRHGHCLLRGRRRRGRLRRPRQPAAGLRHHPDHAGAGPLRQGLSGPGLGADRHCGHVHRQRVFRQAGPLPRAGGKLVPHPAAAAIRHRL